MFEVGKETEVLTSSLQQGQHENNLPIKLAQPARRALNSVGIHNLNQLSNFSKTEIKQLHGIGPNALSQLQQALAENGLSFADKDGIRQEER